MNVCQKPLVANDADGLNCYPVHGIHLLVHEGLDSLLADPLQLDLLPVFLLELDGSIGEPSTLSDHELELSVGNYHKVVPAHVFLVEVDDT
jgi:hypothetical protein